MPTVTRRVIEPVDILARAQKGEPTTGLPEGRVASQTWDEDVELRSDGDGMTFRGYAARFNSRSEDLGGFTETIRPGAFSKSLKQSRAIKMFWNHNQDIPLGSTRGGLSLTEDDKGLLAEGRLPDTTAGRDMAELVRTKIVDSMSFGFQTLKDAWTDDLAKRELVEVRLFEVSPVTGWPAYSATSATVRTLAETIGVEPDLLGDAFGVLDDPEGNLSDEQHRALIEAINARYHSPVVSKDIAEWRAKLAAKGVAA